MVEGCTHKVKVFFSSSRDRQKYREAYQEEGQTFASRNFPLLQANIELLVVVRQVEEEVHRRCLLRLAEHRGVEIPDRSFSFSPRRRRYRYRAEETAVNSKCHVQVY